MSIRNDKQSGIRILLHFNNMSMEYCEDCDKQIDTDFDAEHFDEPKQCKE